MKKPFRPSSLNRFAIISSVISITCSLMYSAACGEKQTASKRFRFIYKDPPANQPALIGKIGDEPLTLDTLDPRERAKYYELEKSIYDFKLRQLEQTAIHKIVTEQAQKQQMSFDEYVRTQITAKIARPDEKQIDGFIEDNHLDKTRITADIRNRIAEVIINQKTQSEIESRATQFASSLDIITYFNKPKLKLSVEVGSSPKLGRDDAPIRIFEFSDFECPHCAVGAQTLSTLVKKSKHASQIQVVFKNFPLASHKNAELAAVASLCVHKTSPKKYWQYNEALFKNQKNLSKDNLIETAKSLKADTAEFKACLDTQQTAPQVKQEAAMAQEMGFSATPTFVFNNEEFISGAPNREGFEEIMDRLLAEKKEEQ